MIQLKVLVVDNEPAMKRAIGRVLSKEPIRLHELDEDVSFTIEESTTGSEAELKIQFLSRI